MTPQDKSKSTRMNDMLDEQELDMLEEEVRLLREEEEIEKAELARLQKEEELVKVCWCFLRLFYLNQVSSILK